MSVEDITVPIAEVEPEDPAGAMPPVTLPRSTGEDPTSRARRRRRRSDIDPVVDADDDPLDEADRSLLAPARRPGRRVVRIVRHVQLWSVFKVALLGGLVFYVIFLIATALGWTIANATGQVHHVEQFMRQIGFDNWTFNGAQLFRAVALGGAIVLVAGTILLTLGAAIINLIAEATGGLRFTVIEPIDSDDDDRDDAEVDDRDR